MNHKVSVPIFVAYNITTDDNSTPCHYAACGQVSIGDSKVSKRPAIPGIETRDREKPAWNGHDTTQAFLLTPRGCLVVSIELLKYIPYHIVVPPSLCPPEAAKQHPYTLQHYFAVL